MLSAYHLQDKIFPRKKETPLFSVARFKSLNLFISKGPSDGSIHTWWFMSEAESCRSFMTCKLILHLILQSESKLGTWMWRQTMGEKWFRLWIIQQFSDTIMTQWWFIIQKDDCSKFGEKESCEREEKECMQFNAKRRKSFLFHIFNNRWRRVIVVLI